MITLLITLFRELMLPMNLQVVPPQTLEVKLSRSVTACCMERREGGSSLFMNGF